MRWIALLVCALAACGDDSSNIVDGSPGADTTVDGPLRVHWELVSASGPMTFEASYVGTLGGRVVLFGGEGSQETWIFDGSAWTQQHPTTSPFARSNGVLVAQNGRAILTGGVGRPPGGSIDVLGETWAFDGTDWTQLADSTLPKRQSMAATAIGDQIVVFGGATPSAGRLDDGYLLSSSGGAWSEIPKMPAARRAAAMTTIGDAAYMTGGSVPGASDEVLRFDGAAWELVGTLPKGGRAYHGSGTLAGRVVVFGGVRTSTTGITEIDAWPGGAELVGEEPASGGRMVTIGDAIWMWRPTTPGMPGELWKLTVAD